MRYMQNECNILIDLGSLSDQECLQIDGDQRLIEQVNRE